MDSRFIAELAQRLPDAFSGDTPSGHRLGGLPLPEIILSAAQESPVIQIPSVGEPEAIPGVLEAEYRLPSPNPDAEARMRAIGIEAIAWYVSFHLASATRWGIYMREDALEDFSSRTFGPLPGLTDFERLLLGWRFVVDHELFHYWTDVACAQMEFATRRPVYLPYVRHHPDLSSSTAQKEEALANARAWLRLPSSGAKNCAALAMKAQPDGYRFWSEYRRSRNLALGKREFGAIIHGITGAFWHMAPFEWFFDEHRTGTGPVLIPFHWVRSPSYTGRPYLLHYARPIGIVESQEFLKQLRRMQNDVQINWQQRTRRLLESGDWSGTDFKKICGEIDMYQCRVGYHHRVRFRRMSADTFQAISISPREGL